MIQVNLDNLPNQSLSIRLNDRFYDLTIKETNGVMSLSIVRDNVGIIFNTRLVGGSPLIPYPYLDDGNFIMLTSDGSIPYYNHFNITQFLVYASPGEIEAAING